MAEEKGKSLKELPPDYLSEFAKISNRESSSRINNINTSNVSIKVGNSYPVAANNACNLPRMVQNLKPRSSTSGTPSNLGMQNIPDTLPTRVCNFSDAQTSPNLVSHSHEHQQYLNPGMQRPSIYPMSLQNSLYSNIQRQQWPVQKQSLPYEMLYQQKVGNQSNPFIHQSESENRQMHLPQKMQVPHMLDSRSYLGKKTKLQETVFPLSQSLMACDQQKPTNPLLQFPVDPSQNCRSQVRMTNSTDWVEIVFQKIQLLKETYMSDVIKLFGHYTEMKNQAINAELLAEYEKSSNSAEKVIRFLHISRNELLMRVSEERAYKILNEVTSYLGQLLAKNQSIRQYSGISVNRSNTPQMLQRGNFHQYNISNQCQNNTHNTVLMPSRQQNSSGDSFPIGPSAGLNKGYVTSLMNSGMYNTMRNTSGSMLSASQQGFQQGYEQKAFNQFLHQSVGDSNLQHGVTPWNNNILNSILQSTPKKILKQPVQLLSEKNMNQIEQSDDMNFGYMTGLNQRTLHQSISSLLPCSPQTSQQSSVHFEPRELSSTFLNSTTPARSPSSPQVDKPPLTPLTPPSVTKDSEKSPSCIRFSSLNESSGTPKVSSDLSAFQDQNKRQSLVIDKPRAMESPSIEELITVEQQSRSKEDPFKRLIRAVESLSSTTLNASLRDIDEVANFMDRSGVNFSNEKSNEIKVQDLADNIRNHQLGNLDQIYETGKQRRVKRRLSTLASDDSTSDIESKVAIRMKRMKAEPHDLIQQEIKEINRTSLEVVVNVIETKDTFSVESNNGILIRCCYNPVGLTNEATISGSSKKLFPTLLLDLILAPDYPASSPVALEELPCDFVEDEEGKDIWMKVKTNLNLSLRKCSQPISLKEMVKYWHTLAHEAFLEFARQRGGGSFSSIYGKWEDPVKLFIAM